MKNFLGACDNPKREQWEKKTGLDWQGTFDKLTDEYFDAKGMKIDREIAIRNNLLDKMDVDYEEYINDKVRFVGMDEDDEGVPESQLFNRGGDRYVNLMEDYTSRVVNTLWDTLKEDRTDEALSLREQIRYVFAILISKQIIAFLIDSKL